MNNEVNFEIRYSIPIAIGTLFDIQVKRGLGG
jgi:hypothetical protein